METAASFEARFAPSSYPTHRGPRETSRHCGRPAPNARAERGLHPFRSAIHQVADTNDWRIHVGGGGEQNKRLLIRRWEVVAPS
jgi:hypothetical protein